MLNYSTELDRLFHALSDPTRRTMVERLSEGPLAVSDLARPIAMSLPAVLQHLQVLEDAGLVSTRKNGRVRLCALKPAVLGQAEQWLVGRRLEWEQRLDRLGDYLKTLDDEGKDHGE